MTKNCIQCNKEFPATDEYYHKNCINKDGLTNTCKTCRNLNNRKYVEINKEKIKEKSKQYIAKNKHNFAEKHKELVRKNKENIESVLKELYGDGLNKICRKCKKEFPPTNENFRKNIASKDLLDSMCVNCRSKRDLEYYKNNTDKLLENKKKTYFRHKETFLAKAKIYSNENREKLQEYRRLWKNTKRKTDEQFCMNERMTRAISNSLNGKKDGIKWEHLVGYTILELMEHIEKLFIPGMSWENRSEWHIDHIKPKSKFNFTTYEDKEFEQCWALNNLRPLWAEENYRKRDKWDNSQQYKNEVIFIIFFDLLFDNFQPFFCLGYY